MAGERESCGVCMCVSLIVVILIAMFSGVNNNSDDQCCECVNTHHREKNTQCEINLSQWSEWSHCSQECGPSGTQLRVRNVLKVTGCGMAEYYIPPEPTSEKRPCNRVCKNDGKLVHDGCDCQNTPFSGQCCDCKNIDCQLSEWSKWSSCQNASSCVKSRDVVRESKCAGTKCKGPYSQEEDCGVILNENMLVPKGVVIFMISCTAALLSFVVVGITVGCIKLQRKKKEKIIEADFADDAKVALLDANIRSSHSQDEDNVSECISYVVMG